MSNLDVIKQVDFIEIEQQNFVSIKHQIYVILEPTFTRITTKRLMHYVV